VVALELISTDEADVAWRGAITSVEVNRLHAEAFGAERVCSNEECDWHRLVETHSLGWVTARHDGRLVGFCNVRGTVCGTRGCRTSWSRRTCSTAGWGDGSTPAASPQARPACCG
jgi:hypothetical protein